MMYRVAFMVQNLWKNPLHHAHTTKRFNGPSTFTNLLQQKRDNCCASYFFGV
jgi:hypothetical protein